MADIKDRIPSNLHPVSAWISMAAEFEDNPSWMDMLWGWATAIDGETNGLTWYDIERAIDDERHYLNG